MLSSFADTKIQFHIYVSRRTNWNHNVHFRKANYKQNFANGKTTVIGVPSTTSIRWVYSFFFCLILPMNPGLHKNLTLEALDILGPTLHYRNQLYHYLPITIIAQGITIKQTPHDASLSYLIIHWHMSCLKQPQPIASLESQSPLACYIINLQICTLPRNLLACFRDARFMLTFLPMSP